MSSVWGEFYRVSTFGESHGKGVGAVVDGCPPNLRLTEEDIQSQLDRRRPGQSDLTTPREEKDQVTILSGTEQGVTLGYPIGLLVHNRDQRPGDYKEMSTIPRPSHADYSYQMKYGIRASSGGGRSSARETIGRVAAGAIAEKWLREQYGIEIVAWVSAVGSVAASDSVAETVSRETVDRFATRCPSEDCDLKMQEIIRQKSAEKDSVGGVVSCVVRGVPPGWGEPVFDKMEACLAHAMLSIPATKGFEIGSGFAGAHLSGSEQNDPFEVFQGQLRTVTNNSGGVQGGVTNGAPIYFRVAFKPPATIGRAQQTVDFDGNHKELEAKGRHDPCVVPRAIPIVEAMTAIVLIDQALAQRARMGAGIKK